MAKKLLLDSLTKALGGIVDGINEENLKLGIWSGKVVLSNVALNVNAFKDKDMPVNIYSGSVESLELSIPWASLATQPVKVKISGVYLLVGPYDKDQLNQKSCQQRIKDSLVATLDNADNEQMAGLKKEEEEEDAEAAKDPGWAASLIMKIVDNIQITVESLHMRYEQYDKRGNCFACGVTMDSFTVRSTDKSWKVVDFVTRNKGEHKLFKKATLLSMAVYLDEKAKSLCSTAVNEGSLAVRDPMRRLISRSHDNASSSGFSKECYILSPLSLEVSAIRNEQPNGFVDPSVTATLKLLDKQGYDISVRKNAYHKFLEIAQSHVELREKIYVLGHPTRPSCPISKKVKGGDPLQWFRFMANLISHRNENSHAVRMMKLKKAIMKENPALKKEPSTIDIKSKYLSLSKR
jgi:vacuolar protein sorting-associated protein 13A/C